MANIHQFGIWGERVARWYLEKKEMVFIASNVRIFEGEIDLIMKDIQRNEIAFVEVKSRTSKSFIDPIDQVSEVKQFKIRKTADFWIAQHDADIFYRFDVVGVVCVGGRVEITHVPFAF